MQEAYNNFFLTLAGGIVLDITNGSRHLVAWFYILYSRQADISQTCCAATLASVWPARHAKASFLFCFLLKVQEVQFAWPLTYFSSSDTVAHAGTRRVTRRGTRNTPVATIASCGTPNPHGWLQPHAMAPAAAYAPETCLQVPRTMQICPDGWHPSGQREVTRFNHPSVRRRQNLAQSSAISCNVFFHGDDATIMDTLTTLPLASDTTCPRPS